jgi:hypothetical protein
MVMGGAHQPIWQVSADWWHRFRNHPFATILALLGALLVGLVEHRFLGWINEKIDENGSIAMREAFEIIKIPASNPLGITGIIAILVLLLAFGHSYIMAAFGRSAGNAFARWIGVLTIIIIGVALMWPLSAGHEQATRIMLTFVICGIVGAGLNETFLRTSAANAQTAEVLLNKNESLATALIDLAAAISNAGPVVIGSQSVAIAKPGSSGTVIGSRSVAVAEPGASGTVIGSQSVASSSGTPINAEKAQALRNGADRVRAGQASRSEIDTLLAHSMLQGMDPAVNAAMGRASQALHASDLR